MDSNKAPVERARAYRDVIGLQSIEKFWSFFDRRGKIGIGKEHVSAARFLHPMTNAEAFSAIHAVGNDAEVWEGFLKRFGNLGCAVFRTVIDDENFRVQSQIREESSDLI